MNIWKRLISRQSLDAKKQKLPPLDHYIKFPSSYPGILPYTLDEILEPQKDVLDRICRVAGNDQYKRYYLPLICRYVAHVHLLPASQYHHHREAGGLLSHGLEVALQSLELFNCSRFAARLRTENENAGRDDIAIWSLGCFIGGLAHDFAKIFSDFKISNCGQRPIIKPFKSSLYDWLQKNNISHYQVEFLPGRHKNHEILSKVTLDYLLPQEIRSYLCSGSRELADEIFLGIHAHSDNIVKECVAALLSHSFK